MALTEEFRRQAALKFINRGRGRHETERVAKEVGVSVTTLNEWVHRCGIRLQMPREKKRPRDLSPSEKFKAVVAYEQLSEDKRGEFLRSNGLHSETIEAWKQAIEKSLESPSKKSKNTDSNTEEKKKIKELEREINQKNKVIAETTALLVLKKKADLIWGTGENE